MRRTKEAALQTRENILNAAAQVILQQGMGAFTIEAIAQEAGVTKGGVLHHFPSKELLIQGLIEQVIAAFNAHLMQELEAEPAEESGRWLRAYIRTIFFADYAASSLIPTLAAALSADEATRERIRQGFQQSQQAAIADASDPVQATIIRLAVDGLVFSRALGVDVLDQQTSRAVYEKLLALTETKK